MADGLEQLGMFLSDVSDPKILFRDPGYFRVLWLFMAI